MNPLPSKSRLLIALIIAAGCFGGCQDTQKIKQHRDFSEDLYDKTVSSMAQIVDFRPLSIEGYGFVAGLNGTGSAECPPRLREYLKQYIMRQLPRQQHGINPDKFINSMDTAVVRIEGLMPPGTLKNDHFDLKVSALQGTQTTSLAGGRLYTADFRHVKNRKTTRILAKGNGPVFIDRISGKQPDLKTGYILGGGIAAEDMAINLALFSPDYITASMIGNRINERFGPDTAKAIAPELILLNYPDEFKHKRNRFLALVTSLYMPKDKESLENKIEELVGNLKTSENKILSELVLEAIGKDSLKKLSELLSSTDQTTRFYAARCMLNLVDDRALDVLHEIAVDKNSKFRVGAVETIGISARRDDAIAMLNKFLRDKDFNVRLTAYEQLLRLDDISVERTLVADSFYVDNVYQNRPKTIYVTRSKEAKVVLFGSPIYCQANIFIESDDDQIIINAPEGQKYVSVMKKHPTQKKLMGPLKSSFEVGDLIKTLCNEPGVETARHKRPGLGVSYSDTIAILKKMCEKGAIKADFIAGNAIE